MVAGHMTKKNGYWYLILMVRDETGRLKQKWISTHLRVEGNKKKAEAMLLAARREYTDFAEIQKRSSDVLVSHYLTTWVKSCRGKVSFGTYEEYQNCPLLQRTEYFAFRSETGRYSGLLQFAICQRPYGKYSLALSCASPQGLEGGKHAGFHSE